MIENGKIHLICRKCGTGIDYLVSRFTNYLPPKCPQCRGGYHVDQSDLVSDKGLCYKAPKEDEPCVRLC